MIWKDFSSSTSFGRSTARRSPGIRRPAFNSVKLTQMQIYRRSFEVLTSLIYLCRLRTKQPLKVEGIQVGLSGQKFCMLTKVKEKVQVRVKIK